MFALASVIQAATSAVNMNGFTFNIAGVITSPKHNRLVYILVAVKLSKRVSDNPIFIFSSSELTQKSIELLIEPESTAFNRLSCGTSASAAAFVSWLIPLFDTQRAGVLAMAKLALIDEKLIMARATYAAIAFAQGGKANTLRSASDQHCTAF